MATNNIINSNSAAIAATAGVRFGSGTSTLNFYDELQSFTPVFTFATPGDLSVVSTTPLGAYTRIGDMVYVEIKLNVTPTYTTSTGEARITGLPYAANASFTSGGPFQSDAATLVYPAGVTGILTFIGAGNNYLNIIGYGSATAAANFSVTQFLTTINYQFRLFVTYLV